VEPPVAASPDRRFNLSRLVRLLSATQTGGSAVALPERLHVEMTLSSQQGAPQLEEVVVDAKSSRPSISAQILPVPPQPGTWRHKLFQLLLIAF